MGEITHDTDFLNHVIESSKRLHRGNHLDVISRVRLGAYPSIRVAWRICPEAIQQSSMLMAFRNTVGFCAQDDPDDLNLHGQMFLETKTNGSIEEHLAEGTYYYTFLLRRQTCLGFWEYRSQPLRFRETIPSAEVSIKRIQDRIRLLDLVNDLSLQEMRHEIARAQVRAQLRVVADAAPVLPHKRLGGQA